MRWTKTEEDSLIDFFKNKNINSLSDSDKEQLLDLLKGRSLNAIKLRYKKLLIDNDITVTETYKENIVEEEKALSESSSVPDNHSVECDIENSEEEKALSSEENFTDNETINNEANSSCDKMKIFKDIVNDILNKVKSFFN